MAPTHFNTFIGTPWLLALMVGRWNRVELAETTKLVERHSRRLTTL
jgi:hypothetical protein